MSVSDNIDSQFVIALAAAFLTEGLHIQPREEAQLECGSKRVGRAPTRH